MNTPLVVGNWKMYGSQSDCVGLARKIALAISGKPTLAQVVIAPPYTALVAAKRAIRNSQVRLAAQNCHWQESGAFTGEISPTMLRDIGCEFVIVGHSERRHIFHESDAMIAQKLKAILAQGMRAILCVGETLEERRLGTTTSIISRQLRVALKGLSKSAIDKIEIAYEPVWAIGTGLNATPEQISQVHKRIRRFLLASFGNAKGSRVRILYGGSVKPENAAALARISEVGGLLVGGASLKTDSFLPIVRCFDDK
jgi:triosephosphate isomerase